MRPAFLHHCLLLLLCRRHAVASTGLAKLYSLIAADGMPSRQTARLATALGTDRRWHPSQRALCTVWPSQPGLLASACSIAVAKVDQFIKSPFVVERLTAGNLLLFTFVRPPVHCIWLTKSLQPVGSVSNSLAGLDWVAGHLQKPAVVLLSLGLTDDASSHALDQVCYSLQRPQV